LKWDVNKQQGAYAGPVYDHNKADHSTVYQKKSMNDGAVKNYEAISAAASMLCKETEKQKPRETDFTSTIHQPEPSLACNPRDRSVALRAGAAIRNGGPQAHELGGTSAPSVLSTRPW
jgi:hypothetical protein